MSDIVSNLLIHLKLDETTGTAASDSSGNGHPGALGGTPSDDSQWIKGRYAGGVTRDAAGSIVITHAAEISGTTYTIAAWLKMVAYPTGNHTTPC